MIETKPLINTMNRRVIVIMSLIFISFSYAADTSSDMVKIRTAVLPFNDMDSKTLNLNITLILKSELSRYEFVEIIPVETITKKLYEIEPSFLWTEKDAGQKRGGMLWTIQPKIVEEVNRNVSADFSIYGDLTRFGDKWRINTHVIEGNNTAAIKSFSITGSLDSEIPEKLSETAKQIANFLRGRNIVHEAEEYVRQYLGGMYTYHVTLEKMSELVKVFPDSVPAHALLLDLYLKQKEENREEIIQTGLKVISLYAPERGNDTRYLLSLNLDPFEVLAGIYEDSLDLEQAVDIRKKALELFPYKAEVHKAGLGKDYYLIAQIFEKKDQKEKALENYEKAFLYLVPSSELYKKTKEGIERLRTSVSKETVK